MTTLRRTLDLLTMCSEVYYRYSYYNSLIPDLTQAQKEENKQTIKIYEAKMTVLLDVLNKHIKKREAAQNIGCWRAQKRFYQEKGFAPAYWCIDTLLKMEKEGRL